ncbi:MAG: hypothetical protein Q8M24_14630 [Pseudolabrys sp.]|nr:hypothetical protein [Pseudolabrys sp.]MDP2296684.1 hypothetical protein [Pseudolabrys sp.]
MSDFSANTQSFSLTREEATKRFLNKWIAVYQGDVAAAADTLPELKASVRALGIPSGQALFRHIDPREKVFIL